LITSSADCDIKIWIKKMNFEFELFHKIENAHSDKICKIIYCENDNIISCSKDRTIKIWEKKHIIMKILIYLMKKKIVINVFFLLLIESKNLLIASGDERTIILNLYNKEIYKIYENVIYETWNALDKIKDNKNIVGGGDDKIITIITISKGLINNVKIDFECYGICSFEEKGIFLVCGKSNDISVYRSDNFSKIFNYNKAHNGWIYGLCKMNNGLIISYSGDNNNKNSIKIWFL
jgi:WD40 repeat protein